MKKVVTAIVFMLTIGIATAVYALGPAPYSEQALHRLNDSAKRVGTFIPPVGASQTEIIKYMIGHYSKMFSDAGYSFEKSIVQLSNDFNKDPEFLSTGFYSSTPAIWVGLYASQINELRKDGNIKKAVDESLHYNTVKALDNISFIIKRHDAKLKAENERKLQVEKEEREARVREHESVKLAEIEAEKEKARLAYEDQKVEIESNARIKLAEDEKRKVLAKQHEELAAIKKRNVLNILNGHYEVKNEKVIKIYGTVDIKVISDDKAIFSIYNKSNGPACKISDKEADIVYDSDKSIDLIFGNEAEVKSNRMNRKTRDNHGCAIKLTFKNVGSSNPYVLTDYQDCRDFCERGGSLSGIFPKVD
jgi:hypothetical protein